MSRKFKILKLSEKIKVSKFFNYTSSLFFYLFFFITTPNVQAASTVHKTSGVKRKSNHGKHFASTDFQVLEFRINYKISMFNCNHFTKPSNSWLIQSTWYYLLIMCYTVFVNFVCVNKV